MLITSREFRSKYYNGSDFTANMSDVNDNLAGSIMEEKQGTFLVTLNLRADAQFNLPFTIKTNNATITRSVGSFNDILKIGDTCSMTWAGGTTTFDIVSINSSGTILTYGNVAGDALIDFADDTAFIICTSDLPDLILNYGIVDNAATTEFVSFIDGTTQGWYVEAMSVGSEHLKMHLLLVKALISLG